LYIPSDPVFAVYCTVLLFSACITEKELLNAGVPWSTQGPYLAPGLEDLLVDLYVITALGFGDCEELSDVLGASVTKPNGTRIIGLIELNLELATVPACLRRVVVWMNHMVDVPPNY